MAMKRCPICGEKFSDTYRSCPFCEEEAALKKGKPMRRGSGRRVASSRRQPNLLSPILIVLILLMAGLLVYLLFGNQIAEKLKERQDTNTPGTDVVLPQQPDVTDPGGETEDPSTQEPGSMPEDPDVSEPGQTADVDTLPNTLTVNNADFTLSVGESYTVKVTAGGSGNYSWISSDDGVASVSQNGTVTGVSSGKVTMTVYDENGKGTFTVYVRGGQTTQTSAPADTVSAGDLRLNTEDYTTFVGDENVQLRVSGGSGVTWASRDTGIATVSDSGLVKAVGVGTTTVTATCDGVTLKCIVRVKR